MSISYVVLLSLWCMGACFGEASFFLLFFDIVTKQQQQQRRKKGNKNARKRTLQLEAIPKQRLVTASATVFSLSIGFTFLSLQ